MPAAYAHIRFGREQALPGKYGALPRNFPQLYTVGLQGPDLLFYHNPVFSTAKVREGHRLHAMTGQAFFKAAIDAYKKAPSDGALAYLFGVLGHYCLDSRVHPLVNQLVTSQQIDHVALETEFDRFLADFLPGMREGDLLMITADHGCDPSYTKTTDHTREYVPYLVCGKGVKAGTDLGTKLCFGTIAKTICEYLEVDASTLDGKSVWQEIRA